jgi:hypothetical protein
MPLYSLSKSSCMLGRQCTKTLWLNKHQSHQRHGAYHTRVQAAGRARL